jgi:CrcB protein
VIPAPLLVGVGGLVGALCRFVVDAAVTGERGTVVVNVAGSVALGGLSVVADGAVGLALGTGFCGAFTTFSSLAVVVAERVERGAYLAAARYGGGVLALALFGVARGRGIALGWDVVGAL